MAVNERKHFLREFPLKIALVKLEVPTVFFKLFESYSRVQFFWTVSLDVQDSARDWVF